MNTEDKQSFTGTDAEKLAAELQSLQHQLEQEDAHQSIRDRLREVTLQIQDLLAKAGQPTQEINAPALQLDQIRSEIDAQREMLAEVQNLRSQIELSDSEVQKDSESSEAPADAAAETVSHSEVEIASPAGDQSAEQPLVLTEERDEKTVVVAGRTTTRVRARRPAPSLPSVRSLKGEVAGQHSLGHKRQPPKRLVSARSVARRPVASAAPVVPIAPAPSAPAVPAAPAPVVAAAPAKRVSVKATAELFKRKPKRSKPAKVAAPPPAVHEAPVAAGAPAPAPSTPAPSVRPAAPTAPATIESIEPVEVVVAASTHPAEFKVKVRWWNVAVAAAVLLPGALAYGWLSVASMKTGWALTELQDVVQSPSSKPRDIQRVVALPTDSPLVRFDGRRDYLVAQALYRIDSSTLEPVKKNLHRAIEREPANVWHRLSLALLEDKESTDLYTKSPYWDGVRRLSNAEPAYWNQLARHWCETGESEKAVAAFRKLLLHRPEATATALRDLVASTIPIDEALRCVPSSAVASLQASLFLREQRVSDWRERTELLLTRIAKDTTKRSAEDLAAEAELCLLLDRTDDAKEMLSAALLRQPDQQEWRLRLARLHYTSEQFDECDKLALQVIRTAPGTDLADQARLLREKIELVTGGGPIEAN